MHAKFQCYQITVCNATANNCLNQWWQRLLTCQSLLTLEKHTPLQIRLIHWRFLTVFNCRFLWIWEGRGPWWGVHATTTALNNWLYPPPSTQDIQSKHGGYPQLSKDIHSYLERSSSVNHRTSYRYPIETWLMSTVIQVLLTRRHHIPRCDTMQPSVAPADLSILNTSTTHYMYSIHDKNIIRTETIHNCIHNKKYNKKLPMIHQ